MLHRPRDFMRTTIFFGAFFAMTTASAVAADPTGDWRVADGVAHIRVAECNGNMWGAVIWEKEPGLDEHNPDVSKRSRPTLGIPVLINMKKKPGTTDQWEGEVYNANDGKSYSSTIKPVGSDKLEVQGCVLGFLCGGETWTRIAGPIPPSTANSLAKAPKTAVAPKTTGAADAANKMQGQKQAPAAADTIGDICLIPDVTRFPH
jgi:uncharacterized protein (DUF2147 family)